MVTEGRADGDIRYPVEFLNTVNLSGMPLSKLELKIGAPVMILRNIDPSHGLCNGACPDTRRSTGGYVVKIGSGAVSWSSKLQSVVALSTTVLLELRQGRS